MRVHNHYLLLPTSDHHMRTQVVSTAARRCVSSSDVLSLVVVCVCQPDIDVFPVPGDVVMRTREINNGACECDSI